jgi:ParB-like chromosome segregation protein Spo0J
VNNLKNIALKDIIFDHDTQMRVETDEQVVEKYAYDMDGDDQFPAVRLLQDGKKYYIIDGWNRLAAAEKCGLEKISAEVVTGSKRDAMFLACAANATHGQHRTPGDIRKALFWLFEDEEYGSWSDRQIADHTRISHTTVSKYRGEFETSQLATSASSEPVKRVGRDGKERTVKPKVEPESFDVEEIEEEEVAAKPAKNGKPLASSKDRDAARSALSTLCKSLNRLGVYDEFIEPLSQIAERLKQI